MYKKWTKEELTYLEEYYGNIPVSDMVEHLGRTDRSIVLKAFRMGLSEKNEIDKKYGDYIRKNYGKMTAREIANNLGITWEQVRNHVKTHKVNAHDNGFGWTEEESMYLEDKLGIMDHEAIAKKLNRSKSSVRSHCFQMGLGSFFDNTELITVSDVARLVGLSRDTVRNWQKLGLRQRVKSGYVLIQEDDLLKWMQTHPERWNATKCDYYFFSRFDWFQKKYKEESEKKRKERWGEWYA